MTKKLKVLFGLILVLLVVEQLHGDEIKLLSKIADKKSGVCPSVLSVSHKACVANDTCTLDSDCTGAFKCCLIECSRKCVGPENTNRKQSAETSGLIRNNLKYRKYSSRSDKVSSKCPKFNQTLSESDCKTLNPKSNCETNYDCSFGKRCCFSDCGSRKCIKIESTTKLSNKKSTKNTKQMAKQAILDPFYPFYSLYNPLNNYYYYDDYYYGFGGGNLRRRIPPTYGSRLNPVLSMPFAVGIQRTRPFSQNSPTNRINQNTLRASASSPSSRAQSRLPRFQLQP